MKKYLAIAALFVLLLVVGVFLFIKSRTSSTTPGTDTDTAELPLNMRPVTKLVPSADGHYVDLTIEKINVPGASKLEYELLYSTADGIQQGVQGRSALTGIQNYENNLLLGSESSGKFRYDQGVHNGVLTLKFRDVDGKFIGKSVSHWEFYTNTDKLSTNDGKFVFTLDRSSKDYFVVMDTLGIPNSPEGVAWGPYGIFSSSSEKHPGKINLSGSVMTLDGDKWTSSSSSPSDTGIFLGTSSN